jgi:uncharacterized damage-inducible protein DinB
MINKEEILRQMDSNAEAIRALLQTISDEQARWKPDPETWSMQEVMEHIYNEERIDFRKHLKEMFSDPPQPWGRFRQEEYIAVENCLQALEAFLDERKASIAWLKSLVSPDWGITSQATFSFDSDTLVLSAGDVLVSWVAHDYLHMRQMNELTYAWNEKLASPFSVEYAGGW